MGGGGSNFVMLEGQGRSTPSYSNYSTEFFYVQHFALFRDVAGGGYRGHTAIPSNF